MQGKKSQPIVLNETNVMTVVPRANDGFESTMRHFRRAERLAWLPGVASLRRSLYERMFRSNISRNMFRGVYSSYGAARLSAPRDRALGYDNPESAAMYFNHMVPDSFDYPAIYWLEKSLLAGYQSIFDVGGHIGIKYYAFKPLLSRVQALSWLVCDVPAVIQRGQAAAAKRDPEGCLQFTSDYARVDGQDVLFASGVVQYLPMTILEWLEAIRDKPRRIIFNTTAIHPSLDFFTLNSIGTAYCPYRVTSEAGFMAQMKTLGYQLVDRWTTPGKGALELPIELGHDIWEYSGFVFDLSAHGTI
jgi:putative methyltransferase (TIGR04325 family)